MCALIVASSLSVADVQSAIDSSSSGDIVQLPPGSETWAGGVTISNEKGITVFGSGTTITRGAYTGNLITIVTNATTKTRLSGISFVQSVDSGGGSPINIQLVISGGFSNPKFRVDNCSFTSTVAGCLLIRVSNSYGLIDHCTITGDDASELIHNVAYGAGVTTGWEDDVIAGSGDALYIEDCTFSKYDLTDPYYWGTSAIQSYYGSRTVVRYSTLNYCQIDQHGTAGAVGARWWEIYNNTFTIPAGGGNQSNYLDLRAGSGVVFNNTKTGGTNAGTGVLKLREEDSGAWPELYQIGRGKNQESDPAYCWNNFKLPSGQATYVIDGRDFFSNTEKPGYIPYTYPHPLVNENAAILKRVGPRLKFRAYTTR